MGPVHPETGRVSHVILTPMWDDHRLPGEEEPGSSPSLFSPFTLTQKDYPETLKAFGDSFPKKSLIFPPSSSTVALTRAS